MDTDVNGATRHHQTRRTVDVESGEQAAGTNGLKAPVTGDAQAAGLELRSRFYQSVAETLTLLHTAPGYDRRLAVVEIARILAATMSLPLVWIGRRPPEEAAVQVLAAAGPESDYATTLQLSNRADEPGGSGPVGIALREHRAQAAAIDAPVFAPWRAAAARHGFSSCIVAAADTRDGGQLILAVYAGGSADLSEDLLDWAQRLADELARFWDHQALVERSARMSRYRDAQRTIQRALLDQPDPDAVYRTLAQSLVDIAGAAAVDVHVAEPQTGLLRRAALVGPIADALRQLSPSLRHDGREGLTTPLLALRSRQRQVRVRPRERKDMSPMWQHDPLAQMGAMGCWPIMPVSGGPAGHTPEPVGVFVIVTREEDAFDDDLCRLLDELADATGLALSQHERRRLLQEEQQRQTYLALHDALTGLPNRRALDMHLECAIARAERSGRLVATGMLDLDDLKPINDRYGHAVGDRLLVEVAQRLQHALRPEDYVARLGGDEFVLVCEGLHHERELEPLLERVWQRLSEPLVIDGVTFQLAASLGIALFPDHARASGEQLLRRADQAMYQVKARKRQRERWWSTPLVPAEPALAPEDDGRSQPPYGPSAEAVLRPWVELVAPRVPALIAAFNAELQGHEGIARLLEVLPDADREQLTDRFTKHVRVLLQPALDIETHRAQASRAGRFHAAAGLEEVWLLEGIERLRDLIAAMLGDDARRDRRALGIVLQRLGLERQWQLESMRDLQRARVALLARLNALAWSADGFLELIQGVVDMLAAHDEIASCAVGRPDASGQLTYEAVGGEPSTNYLIALGRGEAVPIRVNADSPLGGGPTGRAWRTATVQRCLHYGTDPAMVAWREQALAMGVVSSVAVPLCPLPATPSAVLTIYSPYAGGLQSEDQQAFVDQLKNLLDLALARLAPPRPGTALLPFFVRQRWRALIATDALQVHYQPVVRLRDGRVTELEALARLRDSDDQLLMPGRFLPALGDDDLVGLFRQVLLQATAERERLAQLGHSLDMSVNAPAEALQDPRYAEAAAAVLAAGTCRAESLLFEILESPLGMEHDAPEAMTGMRALKALGVRLVEDDLGAGYSSLIRLRQWPFDRIKIDQAIVMQAVDDPLRTLRFIRQLIRLGHDLDLEVVVEGLETLGLSEAALLLGADMGQGYALARPMPAGALPDWLRNVHHGWTATVPSTALGALAGALLWEEHLHALPLDSTFWRQHVDAACAVGRYLDRSVLPLTLLREAHEAMHAAALAGPHDAGYRHARERFLSLLIEQVGIEESQRAAAA
ncbi:diguanylate cyclase [Dyella ginsengisoli]|uniref:Diguanylate cyclase DosC n=1 Tax=Dyella ginsengisoli TaxID=363848 RepID=A0ABW8JWW8_9GAMM